MKQSKRLLPICDFKRREEEAAAKNLLAELRGQAADETFKWELICIVDTLDKGIMVYRSETRKFVFPSKLFHYAKRFFEWWYLRQYR